MKITSNKFLNYNSFIEEMGNVENKRMKINFNITNCYRLLCVRKYIVIVHTI